ncbi:MAG: 16S rRNA (adenine(1518)-N(6)/adenine(1519)-N(6))-dimethyltransferase RsmA [Deltaproteobacteria bacterium]|jgi:16S rRNA (adenine1518-N6/adenine1519-N6)-dimethyltransferase|nr:16S rRNA (adenine(1518)-N(6)/adenine(1519)-N(6))-dimethyltransferase RsmA [Deltaproteobacteria bacterium]
MPDFQTPAEYFKGRDSRPLKHFGQHFLSQPATALKIVQSAQLSAGDAVVEIGPGLGALTRFIMEQAEKIHLIEVDPAMVEYLRERAPAPKAVIYRQDALSFDFKSLSAALGKRLVVLGNLPYNISSPLVFRLLEAFPAVDRAVFMVQKEVGIRFAAPPGSKDYGVLSVLLGIYSRVRKLFVVGPGQFLPPPKVDSIVLRIDFALDPPAGPGFDFLRRLVGKAFEQRRKTLANSLAGVFGLCPEALKNAFEEAGIDPKRRPETLSPSEFLTLARLLARSLGEASSP